MNKKQKKILIRLILSALIMLFIAVFSLNKVLHTVLSLSAYLIIGYDILLKAFRGILNGRIFDENFLMAIATVGAVVLAFYSNSGDFFEAIAVMLFYQLGELFESYAVGKSRRNISALMDIRPDRVNIEINGQLEKADPEDIAVGTVIVVQPGERIPIDGTVIEGASSLNMSALTGESIPKNVFSGDAVISGSINISGVLKIKTEKTYGDSTVSRILQLVEESGNRKSRSERFISKFSGIYTPAVCFGALILAILPPVISVILGKPAAFDEWLYRALTFLVISCPCALVISIPLTFFAGIGGASKTGILIKGSNYLETLSRVKTVVFDKTGTLTQGVFEVSGIYSDKVSPDKLLEYAALTECSSSHPISKSLQQAYGGQIDRSRVSDIEEISGSGITATVDGVSVAVGNERLMRSLNIPSYSKTNEIGTVIHIAISGEYAGSIVISDKVKITSKAAIDSLRSMGIKKTVMLTGDLDSVARSTATALGIDEYRSELLPADKVSAVNELSDNGTLAFVGDGINDAPVLATADIGIAMGALGSDAAIEAADVVLMDDDPSKISTAIRISVKCLKIVYQNIVFALGVKLACLILGAFGITNMWFAIFADVGVMVLAVLNAMRAFKTYEL